MGVDMTLLLVSLIHVGRPTLRSIDVSIPYDAAAKLAYEAAGSKGDYAAFKAQFEADAVADVISKQPVDVSVPYDAAAKLAYEAAGGKGDYAAFKKQFEADAVADVISKQPVDVSVPYDAAAKLAYEAAGSKGDYAAFKKQFEADAVADVVAKQQPKAAAAAAKVVTTTSNKPSSSIDVSIPYDAAARLAYEKAGSKGDYAAFKTKFEADAVADVVSKQKA